MGELGTFGVIFVILVIGVLSEEAPWLLALIVIGIIALFVFAVKNPGNSSGGGYSPSYGDPPGNSEVETGTNSPTKTLIYRGRSKTWEPVLATSRNGQIFEGYNDGLSMSFIRATYQNGYVYDGTVTNWLGTVLGRYDDEGYIYLGQYDSYENRVGYCKDGYIYRGKSTTFGESIGCYEGNRDEAAAAAIVFLFAE